MSPIMHSLQQFLSSTPSALEAYGAGAIALAYVAIYIYKNGLGLSLPRKRSGDFLILTSLVPRRHLSSWRLSPCRTRMI